MNELQQQNASRFDSTPVTVSSGRSSIPPSKPINPDAWTTDSSISNIGYDSIHSGYNRTLENPFASDYFDTKFLGINFGSVRDNLKGDPVFSRIDPFSRAVDFEHLRRESQGAWSAAAGLFSQYLGKTAINTIGGLVAGFYGIGSAIANWDASKIVDNSVARSLDKASEWVDENNSVFTSQRGRDNGALGMFSFDTLKDIGDGLSFISGAILSETILATASGGMSLSMLPGKMALKAARLAGKAKTGLGLNSTVKSKALYDAFTNKLDNVVQLANKGDMAGLEKLSKTLGTNVDELTKMANTYNSVNKTVGAGRKLVTGTFWEGGVEARATMDEVYDIGIANLDREMSFMKFDSEEEREAYRSAKMEEIESAKTTAGLFTFGLNVAFLGMSNAIQFPTIFGGKATHSMNSNAGRFTRGTGDGLGTLTRNTSKSSKGYRAAMSVLRNPITEANEELAQGLISSSMSSYYEDYLGLDSSNTELLEGGSRVADAIHKGVKQTYGTKEGLYEGVIGAILGGMGVPVMRRNSKGKIRPTLVGGISGSIKEFRENERYFNGIASAMKEDNYGSLLNYNKDNAMIAVRTGKKMDLATFTEDVNAMDDATNNIVFSYVKDRLDKGLEEIIDGDVKEIQEMDLDTYKRKMGKDDSFTEEQMKEEVKQFAEKVDVYKNAYDRVHKGLDVDIINDTPLTKRWFDALTLSVANEQIYTTQAKALIEDMLSNPEMQLEAAQLEHLAKFSNIFANNQAELNELRRVFIESKTREGDAKIQALREKLEAKLEALENTPQDGIDAAKIKKLLGNKSNDNYFMKKLNKLVSKRGKLASYLDMQEDVNLTQQELNELERRMGIYKKRLQTSAKTKDEIAKIREAEEILKSVSEKIKKERGDALNSLLGDPDKVTIKDIEDMLEFEDLLESTPDAKLNLFELLGDTKGSIKIKDQFNQYKAIVNRQMEATSMAIALYSGGNVSNALKKSAVAGLLIAINKADNRYTIVKDLLSLKMVTDDLEIFTDLLKIDVNNIEKLVERDGPMLSKSFLDDIDEALTKYKELISDVDILINTNDNKAENTKDEIKKKEEAEAKSKLNKILDDDDAKPEDPNDPDDPLNNQSSGEFSNTSKGVGNPKMLYTVANNKTAQNGELKAILDAINNGTIKHNNGFTLDYQDNLEDTPEFRDYLAKAGVDINSYIEGKKKIIDNPGLLTLSNKKFENLDADVLTFLSHAPIRMTIYSESSVEVDTDDNGNKVQDFTPNPLAEEGSDKFSMFFFAGELTADNKTNEKYRELYSKLSEKHKEQLQLIEAQFDNNEITESEKIAKIFRLNDAYSEDAYDLSVMMDQEKANSNDAVNIQMRASALMNQLGVGTDVSTPVKGRVGNFLNGKIARTMPNDDFSLVRSDDNPNGFVDKASDLKDNIIFGTQTGEYIDFEGNPVTSLKKGSLVTPKNAITGAVYYVHTTQNGQKVPVLLNSRNMGEVLNDKGEPFIVDAMMEILDDFINNPEVNMNPNMTVKLNSSHPLYFLSGKTYPDFFEGLLKEARSAHSILPLNTFTITRNPKEGEKAIIQISTVGLAGETIGTENYEALRDRIKADLMTMKFNLNRAALLDGDLKINKDAFNFVFDNALVSHGFRFDQNRDQIFEPFTNENKNGVSMQLHLLNNPSNLKSNKERKTKIGFKEQLSNLFKGNSYSKSKANNFIYGLNSQVIKIVKDNRRKFRLSNPSEEFNLDEAITQAVKEVVDTITSQVNAMSGEAGKYKTPNFEDKLKEGVVYNFKANPIANGKIVDYALAMLHNYKLMATNDVTREVIKSVLDKAEVHVTLRDLMLGSTSKEGFQYFNTTFKFVQQDSTSEEVEIEIDKGDGVTEVKKQRVFRFKRGTKLTSDPRASRAAFDNLFKALSMLNAVSSKYGQSLFRAGSKSEEVSMKTNGLTLNHTRVYAIKGSDKKGVQRVNLLGNSSGVTTKNMDTSWAPGSVILQHQFTHPDPARGGQIMGNKPFTFKYKLKDGTYTTTENPQADFELDPTTGELLNGIIIMNTVTYNMVDGKRGDKASYKQSIMAVGENNLNDNEGKSGDYIDNIELPMINSDFDLIKAEVNKFAEILNRSSDKGTGDQVNLISTDNKLDDKLDDSLTELDKEIEEEVDDELESMGQELINSSNASQATSNPIPTEGPSFNNRIDEPSYEGSLAPSEEQLNNLTVLGGNNNTSEGPSFTPPSEGPSADQLNSIVTLGGDSSVGNMSDIGFVDSNEPRDADGNIIDSKSKDNNEHTVAVNNNRNFIDGNNASSQTLKSYFRAILSYINDPSQEALLKAAYAKANEVYPISSAEELVRISSIIGLNEGEIIKMVKFAFNKDIDKDFINNCK